ncbi:MAG: hypothetical protein KF865_06350 [Bdellovibrionaceae bacterium]|nr:hypothetical protein [Pseudobdellovibrionaceae bacterium]
MHAVEGVRDLPILLMLGGTGVYSTGDAVENNGILKSLVDRKKVIVLTLDKPGISYSATAPRHFVIDDLMYNQYTQRDLVRCAGNALKWVSEARYASTYSNIHFLTQSEGTQVAVRIYDALSKQDPGMARRIRSMFMVGLVMRPWRDIINAQLPDPAENANFWKAYQNRDDVTLRSFGGLAYAYWNEILSVESNEDALRRLAAQGPAASLQIFHGLKDVNTLVQPVMDFEVWNNSRLQSKSPRWDLAARYYNAPHGLNMAAFRDILSAFESELKR